MKINKKIFLNLLILNLLFCMFSLNSMLQNSYVARRYPHHQCSDIGRLQEIIEEKLNAENFKELEEIKTDTYAQDEDKYRAIFIPFVGHELTKQAPNFPLSILEFISVYILDKKSKKTCDYILDKLKNLPQNEINHYLIGAVNAGNAWMVELLIEAGGNVNLIVNEKPLLFFSSTYEMIILLLLNNAQYHSNVENFKLRLNCHYRGNYYHPNVTRQILKHWKEYGNQYKTFIFYSHFDKLPAELNMLIFEYCSKVLKVTEAKLTFQEFIDNLNVRFDEWFINYKQINFQPKVNEISF